VYVESEVAKKQRESHSKAIRIRVGAAIRAQRIKRSISQQRLADLAQISRNYLHQIEHGEGNPTLDVIATLFEKIGFKWNVATFRFENTNEAVDEADLVKGFRTLDDTGKRIIKGHMNVLKREARRG